jgi:hypothetical protein
MMDTQPPSDPTGGMWPLTTMSNFHLPIRFLKDMPAGWSITKSIPPSTSSSTATALLLDHFYSNCWNCFSWVLPKQALMTRVSSSAADLYFLVSALTYLASLHDQTISSEELREAVCSQACGPLPMTPYTIQALLVLSQVALGEDKFDLSSGWLDRAIQIGLDIGMQHKSFADAEADPVMAESYRRTWWSLYIYDCSRAVQQYRPTFSLFRLSSTTELPCEEWEYQSGVSFKRERERGRERERNPTRRSQ